MEKQILICCGTGCRANGSMKVAEALSEAAGAKGAKAQVIAEVTSYFMSCIRYFFQYIRKLNCQLSYTKEGRFGIILFESIQNPIQQFVILPIFFFSPSLKMFLNIPLLGIKSQYFHK